MKDRNLLICDCVSLAKHFPTFRRIVAPSALTVMQSKTAVRIFGMAKLLKKKIKEMWAMFQAVDSCTVTLRLSCECPSRAIEQFNKMTDDIYLLTPRRRVLLEKLTNLQVVKKFSAFYGTRRFIVTFTNALHLSLSWASSIQSITPHPASEDPP